MAVNSALETVRSTGNRPVPLHLRNAPTELMKKLDYGTNYKYAHDYPGHFVRQQFMPEELGNPTFWHPADNPAEEKAAALQRQRWGSDKK